MQSYLKIPELPLEPPEPDVVCTCSRCQEGIYDGEEFFSFDGLDYCRECFMDSAAQILLDSYGAERRVAERSSQYDYYNG